MCHKFNFVKFFLRFDPHIQNCRHCLDIFAQTSQPRYQSVREIVRVTLVAQTSPDTKVSGLVRATYIIPIYLSCPDQPRHQSVRACQGYLYINPIYFSCPDQPRHQSVRACQGYLYTLIAQTSPDTRVFGLVRVRASVIQNANEDKRFEWARLFIDSGRVVIAIELSSM